MTNMTQYDIPLLVEKPIKEATQTAIALCLHTPIHLQDLQPFIVSSVTISNTDYLEIATISGVSERLGKFVVIITGMALQDEKLKDVTAHHTITVLSGFKCNVALRFITDVFCMAIAGVLASSPVETFSLVVDKCFPVNLLDCVDDPLNLIEDFVDRYISRVKPDLDNILDSISDPPECDLDDQLAILKIKACMEHDCPNKCSTECICNSSTSESLWMSEILDIGSKHIMPITSIIEVKAERIEGPEEPLDKDPKKFAKLLKPKTTTTGDAL